MDDHGRKKGKRDTRGDAAAKGPGAGRRDGDGERPPRIRRVPDPRLSRSLEYGLALLECFSPARESLGISDLAEIVGISRSTTHRYATTLATLGRLEQDSKRRYRLASRAIDPGLAAIGAVKRRVHAEPILAELREQTGHTVSMGALDDMRVLYVHRLLAHRSGQHEVDGELGVGAPLPLHCTALGKALMASMPDAERAALLADLPLKRRGPNSIASKRRLSAELDGIRERGLAVSDEELRDGLRAIAVAVAGAGGPRVAIDVTVPSSACTANQLVATFGPLVQQAAARIASGVEPLAR